MDVWTSRVTKIGKVKNECIRVSFKMTPWTKKLRGYSLAWYGHIIRNKIHVNNRVANIKVEGWKGRESPRKRLMVCIIEDIKRD